MLLNDTTRLSVTCLGRVANWMLGYCHFGGFIPDAVDHITPTCHRSAETLSYSLHRRDLPSGHRTLSYTASPFTEWRINNSNLFLWYWKQGEKQVFFGILRSWNSFGFMHDPQEFQPGENTKMWREDVFHGRAGKLWNGSTFVWRGTDTLQPVSLKRVHYTGGAGGGRWRWECEWGLMGIIWRWKTNVAAGGMQPKPPAIHAGWICGLFCWSELQPLGDLTLFM